MATPLITVDNGILYPALRKAGVTLGPQRGPSPAQFQDAIDELNRLIGSLNCDRLFIYSLDILSLALTPSKKAYTIGQDPTGVLTADFNMPAPMQISEANVILNGYRYPVVLATPQVWASIRAQDMANAIPETIYCDYAYPISTIYVYGQPQAGTTLELYTWHTVPKVAYLSDAVMAPDGYEDALVLNLACRLAPQFQRPVDADLRDQARLSLMRVLSFNAPQPILDTSGLGGSCHSGFNVYSGN